MKLNINKYFTNDVIFSLQDAIAEADGNEVFFTGTLNSEGLVSSVKVGARGMEHSVPVHQHDARTAEVLIHNHPSGVLVPSGADLGVAEKSAANGTGFYIINNDVSAVYVVVEPVRLPQKKMLNTEEAGDYISQGGALSKISENFEERPVQIELLKNIADSYNSDKIGVFEAGTGVGKSYSYLIPSVLWALENNEKIVISTGTINLQQQLCEKDIPFIEKIIGRKINFILMKGRQNYICLRRLNDCAGFLDLFEDETNDFNAIMDWTNETSTGSKSEIPFQVSENVWSKINSESDACMGMKCPYHSECYVMKVRKEALSANIVVVNHHLLFADIQSRMNGAGYEDAAVLPPYKRIVFDEAHGIESAATSFFSESINRFKLNKLLFPMYHRRKNSEAGHLCTMAILSANEEKAGQAYEITSNIKSAIEHFELAAKDLLGNEFTKRIYQSTARDFGPFIVAVSELAKYLGQFSDVIRIVMEGIDDDDKDAPAYWESKVILRHLDEYVVLLKNFCSWDEFPNEVFWIQKRKLNPAIVKDNSDPEYIILTQTPLDISYLMKDGVLEPMNSIIFTSATLKTGRDFNYWMNRIGIGLMDKERISTAEFDSPFPYKTNMLFAVPSDAPVSDAYGFQQYIEMAIPRLIEAAQGRTLVLFTSYESLRSAYRTVSAMSRTLPGRILRQGEDDNARLLETFKNEKESVLFATDSFWQGVDIPGESLSQVIIVKLPFTVPNDPVFVAKSEAIENRGGNSFMDLSVPEAVIKFRQGVGRLIRRSDDKGVVVVLDRRIYEKRYGSVFLASIPECKKVYEPLADVINHVKSFIFD